MREDPVRLFWEHATELFCVLDGDGRFVEVNPAWQRVLGYRADELIGVVAASLLVGGDQCATASAETLPGTTQRVILDVENRYRHADGSVRWLRWNGYERDGWWYGTAQDITATRTADMALRLTERRARAVLEALDDGIVILDPRGRVLEANETFAQMVGRPISAIVGAMPPFPWWPPEELDRLQTFVANALSGRFEGTSEITIMRPDGRRLHVLISVATLPAERTGRALLAVLRDITEQVALREELLRAHRDARISVWRWYPGEDHYVIFGDGIRGGPDLKVERSTAEAQEMVLEGREELERLRNQVAAGERDSFELDARVALPDGGTTWVYIHGEPITTPEGTVIGVRGTSMATTGPRLSGQSRPGDL